MCIAFVTCIIIYIIHQENLYNLIKEKHAFHRIKIISPSKK